MIMDEFLFVNEFAISFDYQGRRMAIVKAYESSSSKYYDCVLFRDNTIRVHYNGQQWVESDSNENTPIADALGSGIVKVLGKDNY